MDRLNSLNKPVGLSYAFGFMLDGDQPMLLVETDRAAALRARIPLILETVVGERNESPEVGSRMIDHHFRRFDRGGADLLSGALSDALRECANEIELLGIQVEIEGDTSRQFSARIEYLDKFSLLKETVFYRSEIGYWGVYE